MKKRLILSVLVLVLLFSTFSIKVFSADDYTIGKREITRYIDSKGLNLKEGTPEYFDFLNNLLWGEYNKDLQNSPYFRKIVKYAAYYYAHPEILYPAQCKDRLDDIITNNNTKSTTWVYNPSLAVNYAYQYSIEGGKGQNPDFPDFRNKGGDCTNFASRVVNAGKVPIDGSGTCSSYSTITKWYVNRAQWWCLQSRWAWSTSWSIVGDFYTYQSQYKNNATSSVFGISQINSLRASAVPGDVIQLETGGSKWHSLIVTKKQNGETYLTYHSGPNGYDCVDHSLQSIINGHSIIDHFYLLHFH
ncbi:MAG: amidase domain-containing protein [Caldisericaceae bacterium]